MKSIQLVKQIKSKHNLLKYFNYRRSDSAWMTALRSLLSKRNSLPMFLCSYQHCFKRAWRDAQLAIIFEVLSWLREFGS